MSGDLQAVAIGSTNLVATMIAMSVIDKIRPRTMLLVGSVGTGNQSGAGVAYIFSTKANQHWLVWLLVGFIAFFAFSQGAVIWVYLSEVFPNRVRANGQALGSFTHWIMNAIISGIFPMLAASGGGAAPFVFFAAMMVVQFSWFSSGTRRRRATRWKRCRSNSALRRDPAFSCYPSL